MQTAIPPAPRRLAAFAASAYAVLGCILPGPTQAGVNSWTQVGPEGGAVCTLVSAPSNPDTLYATVGSFPVGRGFFRSSTNGDSWVSGGGVASIISCLLTVDAGDPARLYSRLGDWLYRSSDGGDSWVPMFAGFPTFHTYLAQVVVAASDPSFLLVADGSKIYRSRTRGDSWETIWSGDGPMSGWITRVVIDPVTPGRVFALASEGPFRSDDFGATWTPTGAGLPGVGTNFFDLVFDPAVPGRIYLSTSLGIHRSLDGGASWQLALSRPSYGTGGPPICVGPDGAVFLLETYPAGQRLLRSRDAGSTWETLPYLFSITPFLAVTSLTGTPRALFVTTSSGVLQSLDGGDSWHEANRGLKGTAVRALSVDRPAPGALWGLGIDGALGRGAVRSLDRGRNWEFVRVNPDSLDTRPVDLAVAPSDPERILVAGDFRSSPGWVSGLAISRDAGRTWTVSPGPDECLEVRGVTVDPRDSDRLYLTGSTFSIFCPLSCTTFSSEDLGATWQCIQPEDPEERLNLVAPHPGLSGLLLALGRHGIYRSTDAGAEWELAEPTPVIAGTPEMFPPVFTDVQWADDDTVYATNFGAGLYVSQDRGATWAPAAAPPDTLAFPWLGALAVDPFHAGRIFAMTSSTPYGLADTIVRSLDAGLTWDPLSAGLLGWPLSSLILDPVTPSRLYVSAEGGGVLAYDIEEPEPCVPSATALCITDGRFKIESLWRDFAGHSGAGHAVPLASDTGSFWFFDPNNLELFVKAIDGVSYNNAFWTFYGALSNVEFTLLATDTATGAQYGYFNPIRTFASRGDIESFPQEESLASPASAAAAAGSWVRPRAAPLRSANACVPNATTLCLAGGRFAASVTWHDFAGRSGTGTPIVLTPDTGSFWFFDAGILELAVKVIDGRGTNNAWWVFYGSLSNVEFELTVVDTTTGDIWTRSNPSGTFASGGDIEAFPQ